MISLDPERHFVVSEKKYAVFTESERLEMLEETKKMFQHGYDNYMRHAFPLDELNPLDCAGRGPDTEHPDNMPP